MSSPRLFTRREVLRIGGLSLALAPWASAATKSFEFVAINDTHYTEDACRPWQERVVKAMREDAPELGFVLHAGDLTEHGDAASLTAMRDIYTEAKVSLHCVPGNHDHVGTNDRAGYDAAFPKKLNYTFNREGWQFIGLDTTQGTGFVNTRISEATLAWLDEQTLDPKMPTFVFTHFPLGEGVASRPVNAEALIQRLSKLNLKWVHSGHWHGESVKQAGGASLTTSRCCARLRSNHDKSPLKGWHVYQSSADGTLSRRWVNVPA